MTELTKIEANVAIPSRENDIALFRERDGGMAHGLVLTRLKVGGGGATQYQDQFGEMFPRLTGVIMVARKARVFYVLSFEESGGGEEPDCTSYDMERAVIGFNGEFGGLCDECPKNEWGTGRGGRGKACREGRTIAIASREVGPALLRLPPSSINPTDNYLGRLEASGLHYAAVETEISLIRVEKKGVPAFARAQFKLLRELPDEERWRVRNEQLMWIDYVESYGRRDETVVDADADDDMGVEV